MSRDNSLSQRGTQASHKPVRVDLEIYQKAMENHYDAKSNPEGCFAMNVAENHLCWEMLRERIEKVARENSIPDWVASYGDPAGVLSFREATAAYLSAFLVKENVDAETLAFSVGATSTIEMTAFLLANPGDTAVIPAPSYPVYTMDIGVIPGVKRFDLQTHHDLGELRSGIPIKIEQLEAAKEKIEATGSRFRMLILTSPDNPTGGIYSQEQFEFLADWCEANKIHLIVNEIYGLSMIDISHPDICKDYLHPITFVSFGQLMAKRKSPFLHLWYSFSKDLGISGFRIGLTHSYNTDFIAGYRNAGLSHGISNYTQWVLTAVLEDHGFMREFIAASQKALTQSYLIVINHLKALNITYSPSYGSLFVWMDMSEFLTEDSEKGQHDLWLDIYQNTGILVTPGEGFGQKKKGLFRVVISSISHQALEVAMDRLKEYILEKRS
jgi:aspartate/methionine/tyrosine aminotransferase